jgi:hypothetical protein
MPRVPVYESQAAPTLSTGMVSYDRAQMDSRPFIQAALAEGEAAAQTAKMISDYADGRIKAEGTLSADNALLGAEMAMQQASSNMVRSPDLGAVFGADLTNDYSWQGAVNEIQADAQSSLNPYARKLFNAKFRSLATKYGANLRVKIDERVDKSLVSSWQVKLTEYKLGFGNINNNELMPDSKEALRAYKEYTTKIANEGMALVASGRMLEETLVSEMLKANKDIAKNAVTLLFNEQTNPVEAYQALTSGDAEDLEKLSKSHPNAAYALHMLKQAIPDASERQKVIADLRKQAFDQYDTNKKLEDDEAKKLKETNTKLQNEFFERSTNNARREEIRKKLESQDFITPAMQKLMKDFLAIGSVGLFRQPESEGGLGDDEQTVQDIDGLVGIGMLSLDQLTSVSNMLTQETYRSFMNDVGTIRNTQWTEAVKVIESEFNYAEERGTDIEPYENAAKLSFRRAKRAWLKFKRSNQDASPEQIKTELNRVIDEEWKNLDVVLKVELKAEVDALKNFQGLLPRIPVLQTGQYDYSQVVPAIRQHIIQNPNSAGQLAPRIDELLYLLDMVGSR